MDITRDSRVPIKKSWCPRGETRRRAGAAGGASGRERHPTSQLDKYSCCHCFSRSMVRVGGRNKDGGIPGVGPIFPVFNWHFRAGAMILSRRMRKRQRSVRGKGRELERVWTTTPALSLSFCWGPNIVPSCITYHILCIDVSRVFYMDPRNLHATRRSDPCLPLLPPLSTDQAARATTGCALCSTSAVCYARSLPFVFLVPHNRPSNRSQTYNCAAFAPSSIDCKETCHGASLVEIGNPLREFE